MKPFFRASLTLLLLIFTAVFSTPCAAGIPSLRSSIVDSFEKMQNGINEIQKTINETKSFIDTVGRFVSSIVAIFRFISSFVGGTTLLFLFLVVLIASGFRSAGFAGGKTLFLSSMLIADFLYFLWAHSAGTSVLQLIFSITKINITVILPVAGFILLRKACLPVSLRLRFSLMRLLKIGKPLGEVKETSALIRHHAEELAKKMSEDVATCKTGDKVVFSEETILSLNKLKAQLLKF